MHIQPVNNQIFNSKQIASKTKPKILENKALVYGGEIAAVMGFCAGALYYKNYKNNSYIKNLAFSLSKEMGVEVKLSQLKSVLSPKGLLKEVKALGEQNYKASEENILNGIFSADLHSHSNFSDGEATVKDIMDQAAKYGDKLNKISGKKFVFALTDHNGVEGVKEALKIIAKDPEKFNNVKFIPAAELSFPIKCEPHSPKSKRNFGNPVEMPEVLIYGINPFSKNSEEYFSTLYKKRKNGIKKALKFAEEKVSGYKFSEEEFNKFFLLHGNSYCMHNQHWGIYHYLNLKTAISDIAKSKNQDPNVMFDEILTTLKNRNLLKNRQSLNTYLREQGLATVADNDIRIDNLKPSICPALTQSGEIHAPAENTYKDIVDLARKENAVLALAHPGFTLQNMVEENIKNNLKKLKSDSKGKLIYAEKFHQNYPIPKNITEDEITQYNKFLDEAGFIHLGGRDNHFSNFANFNFFR